MTRTPPGQAWVILAGRTLSRALRMAWYNPLDWWFGAKNFAKSFQSQNDKPYLSINPQPVAPEDDTIRSDATALPYRADDLDNWGCESDAMREAYLRLYREEPSLKSAVEGKAESIASLDVTVQPADDKNPIDKRAAEFVEWAIDNSPHGWDGLFLNVLKPAFLLGWSCQEIVLRHVEPDESGEWGGLHGLRHCRSLNTAKLRLQLDAYRNVRGVVNTVRGLASYARRKVLLFTHNELFHNPFGSGDAATAYKDARVIDDAFKLWGYAAKIYGGPFLIGKYTMKDTRKALETALEHARQGGWMTMPKDAAVEVLNLASAASFSAFQDKVKKHEERVFQAVRGAYLPFMQGTSGGDTRGSADTSKSAGSDPKEYLIGLAVCRAINRDLVPHLVRSNFPPGTGMPKVRLGGVNWSETKTQLEVAKGLKELGCEVEEEYLAKVTGMPIKAKAVQGVGGGLPGGPGAGPGGAGPGGGPSPSPSGPLPRGGGGDGAGQGGPTSPPAANPAPPPPPSASSSPPPAVGTPAAATTQPATGDDDEVPPELLEVMLDLAERGDHAGLDALIGLTDDPDQLADVMDGGESGPNGVKVFADGGFTGTVKDSLGRTRHYVNGKQVKGTQADIGGKHTATPVNQQPADEYVRQHLFGDKKLTLSEVKNVGHVLKHMTTEQIKKLRADLVATGHGVAAGRLKQHRIDNLMAWVQTHKQDHSPAKKGLPPSTPKPAVPTSSPAKFELPDDPMTKLKPSPPPPPAAGGVKLTSLPVGGKAGWSHTTGAAYPKGEQATEAAAKMAAKDPAGEYGVAQTGVGQYVVMKKDGTGKAGTPAAAPPATSKQVGHPGNTHADANGSGMKQFVADHPHAGKLQKGDGGIPNPALPDAARPPVPDKQTALYLNNYSWGYDKEMNAALRDTGAPPPGDYGGYMSKPNVNGPAMHAALQEQFKAAKPFKPPATVHRGIKVDADTMANLEAAARQAMGKGGAARMPGYISTATAKGSSFGGNVQFEIQAVHGIDLKPYSHFGHEQEMLLNHNSKFRVTGVENKNGTLKVKLAQIPPDEQARTAAVLDGKKPT